MRWVSGNSVIEMSYIMPLFFSLFVIIIHTVFYYHDKAIIGGIATLDNMPVTVIGEQKGKKAKENMERNFGMPNPEGYRKAVRLMKQAEKFQRPIITFIDTPGAYPGLGAEERGQRRSNCQIYVRNDCFKSTYCLYRNRGRL